VLRLIYLKDGEVCDYAPDPEELVRFERTVLALWRAIEQATAARDFRPRPSRLCGWCSHQQVCPAFGGTPPAYPQPSEAARPGNGCAESGSGAASDSGAESGSGAASGNGAASDDDVSSLRRSQLSAPMPIQSPDPRLPSAT
jgi:putative RecB family exonuclease